MGRIQVELEYFNLFIFILFFLLLSLSSNRILDLSNVKIFSRLFAMFIKLGSNKFLIKDVKPSIKLII